MSLQQVHKSKTIAQADMRNINRSAVLEFLRQTKLTSRTEIAKQLQISMPTAMRIIEQLVEEGLVIYTGEKESGKGRSRNLLSLNTENNLVVGINLSGSQLEGCIATIGGDIIQLFNEPVTWKTAEDNFQFLVHFIEQILQHPLQNEQRILGIAIAVPGFIDRLTGNIRVAPSLDWYNLPLQSRLEPLFDLPLVIENDVNLAILGEYWFGAAGGVDDVVMLLVGTGIGAGILLDGKLHRGFHGASGEVGYLLPDIHSLNQKYPGFGALELMTSEEGIVSRAKAKCQQYGLLIKENFSSDTVFEAAREGEGWALEVVAGTVDYLSMAIANISVCFDPELILLGGHIASAADLLLVPIQNRLQGVIPHIPRIEKSQLNSQAVLLGSVVLTFQKVTEYSKVFTA
ncbi:MAG: ROK family protein [Anaerolineaceae bacterium]|nr:ROK family protein [Anaerolineaceae bacterium]